MIRPPLFLDNSMLSFRTTFRAPEFKIGAVNQNAAELADKVAETHANNLKIAIASGKTLGSVHAEAILNSPSRGEFRRSIMAKSSWVYIQMGRRVGAKMPVHVVGTNSRGRPMFEPLPAMLSWFRTLNIPRAAWFPIMRAIKRRGIKPRDIQKRALNLARGRTMQLVTEYARKIALEMFAGGGGGPTE
jgi:hypothetical protein